MCERGECKCGKRRCRRASMTVEAAFVLPFFFLCVCMLTGTLDIYAEFAKKTVQLQEMAEKAAVAKAAVQGASEEAAGADEGIVDMPQTLTFRPPGFAFPAAAIRVRCRGRVRAWIGYTGGEDDEAADGQEQLVYVTDYESVYHTSSDCTHLDLSWEAVTAEDVAHRHNEYGKHYHACEKCIGSGAARSIVYISPQGDRYHNAASCSGLTRHVRLVKESEVSGLHICSRCAAAQRSRAAA